MTNTVEAVVPYAKTTIGLSGKYDKFFPRPAVSLFGCMNCDWRFTSKCSVCPEPCDDMVVPKEGICDNRKNWVLSFLPVYATKPTVARFMLDMVKGFGHKHMFDVSKELEFEQDRLDRLRIDGADDKDVDRQKLRVDLAFQKWMSIYKEQSRLEDQQVTRETPKKVEMEVIRRIPLSTLHSIMRGDKIEDAEFREQE